MITFYPVETINAFDLTDPRMAYPQWACWHHDDDELCLTVLDDALYSVTANEGEEVTVRWWTNEGGATRVGERNGQWTIRWTDCASGPIATVIATFIPFLVEHMVL